VLSQVFLSFGIPFALIPLLIVTSRKDVMGRFVNRRASLLVLIPIAGCLVSLNAAALYVQFVA
jgi:manganese transport protein